MTLLVQDPKHVVPDGAGHHVDDEVRRGVVGARSVLEMEDGGRRSVDDVKEMHLKTDLNQFSGHERTDQPSTEAVDPHGCHSEKRVSKIAAAPVGPFMSVQAIMKPAVQGNA